MRSRERSPMPRRGFLLNLASLPLIGGGLTLIGQPTAVATPVTDDLLWSYKNWLHMEHRMLSYELSGHDVAAAHEIEQQFAFTLPPDRLVPHIHWHTQWGRDPGARGPAGWITAPQPSTRAAVVMAAAGVDLTDGGARG